VKHTGLAAIGFTALLAAPALSAPNEWTSAGPSGADLQGLEYGSGGVAVAVTHRRVWRSTDRGVSWTQVLAAPYATTSLIAMNPLNSNQLVVALDKLYRSSDGGLTWSPAAGQPPSMYAGATRPSAIAWTRDGSAVWIGTSPALAFRSADGGATWETRSTGITTGMLSSIVHLEVDAVNPEVLYADTPQALYRTMNGGISWNQIANPNEYGRLGPSRSTSGLLLAARTSDGALLRSTDFGSTWVPWSAAPHDHVFFAPSAANKVYSMDTAGRMRVSGDGGATWSNRASLPVPWQRTLVIDPADADRLLTAGVSGAFSSDDGGGTWQRGSSGMNELYFLETAARSPGLGPLFATSIDEQVLYQRAFDGQWTGLAASSSALLGQPGDSALWTAVAPSDGTLYLARSASVARSIDGGLNWELRSTPQHAGTLTVDPANSLVVYCTDRFQPSLRSADGGATWAPVGGGVPAAVAAFAFDPANSNIIYALSANHNLQSPSPLYRSNDGGITWTPTAWSFSTVFRGNVLAIDPSVPAVIYVGLDNGLYKTTDSGSTWTKLNPYPQAIFPVNISSIAIALLTGGVPPEARNAINVSTTQTYGPMRSVDGGATWELLRAAASEGDDVYIDRLAVIPGSRAQLLGLGGYGGMFEMEVAPDLRITSSSATVTVGLNATTTFTVTNNGQYSATSLLLDTAMPDTTSFTSQDVGNAVCARTPTPVVHMVCKIGVLGPGASAGVSITLAPGSPGTWSAVVNGYERDPDSTNNQVDVIVQARPPPANPPSNPGGGGGGRIDYLLLVLLNLALLYRLHGRRRFGGVFRRVRHH
jgi:photosystem II stability/assembly factor-like uncharacterized protein